MSWRAPSAGNPVPAAHMSSDNSAIRVVVADDHPVVRSGIRDELAKHADLELVAEATDGDQALELASSASVDVLVLDLSMPGLPAVKVAAAVEQLERGPRILVLSAYGDLESVQAMMRAGVRGYMLKDEDPTRIAEGIREVAKDNAWISHQIGDVLWKSAAPRESFPDLTPREREVLELMALGHPNPQIADELFISEGTVKNHVTRLYTKLDVNSRAEAVAWAWQKGIVGPNDDDTEPAA